MIGRRRRIVGGVIEWRLDDDTPALNFDADYQRFVVVVVAVVVVVVCGFCVRLRRCEEDLHQADQYSDQRLAPLALFALSPQISDNNLLIAN